VTSLSLLSFAAPKETKVPESNVKFTDFAPSDADAIEMAYVRETEDQETFDLLALDDYEKLSCWDYPGNIGCWVGDWLVSCEKNANTKDEWDCGVTHADDLD